MGKPKDMLPKLAIILGGARSGKSAFAERLVEAYAKPMVYVATAQAFDAEMRGRIAIHRDRRTSGWQTVEAPLQAAKAVRAAAAGSVVLLDCTTLWLSNHLLAETDLAAACDELVAAVTQADADIVVVGNEVGMSIVPDNALARRFRDEQGRLNQRLAAQSDLAVLVVAGLPMVLKGSLPAGLA